MIQLKLILRRLRKPSVVASLTSQIITVLVMLDVNIDATLITSIISTLTSIFIVLGIFSNPDAQKKGYGDDICVCGQCNKLTQHVKVGENLVCATCGCPIANDETSGTVASA